MQYNKLLGDNDLKDILSRGTTPIDKFYDAWGSERFTKEMENLFV